MKYYITNLRDIDYNLKNTFIVKAGQKAECTKEVYEYLSKTYGASGWFTFHKDNLKEADVAVNEVKEVEKEPEVKAEQPKNKRKGKASNKKAKQAVEAQEV
jgi:hypothetical protein